MEPTDGPDEGPPTLLRLDSIRNRILVLALLATLIPAFSTAVLSFERTRRALTETLEAELQRAGSQTARELDLWEKERAYDLRVFSGSFEVTENLPRVPEGGVGAAEALSRVTDYLTRIQSRFPDFGAIEVTDAAGRSIASSRPDRPGTDLRADWLPDLEEGEAVFGEPFLDARVGVVSTMAVPVLSAEGRFLGALVATLAFSTVAPVLEDFAPGESGRIELVTEDGLRIASSSSGSDLEAALGASEFAALTAATGGMMEYVDLGGADMVGLVTPVERMGWSVLVHVPTTEAYGRIAQLRRTTTVLVSVLLLFVGVAAYFIGLLIVRPLDRLTGGAAAVAAGDLSVDLPVKGRDEVAMLTRVFNGMVSELRTSRRKLDEANETLREQNAELEQISITDALTQLFNRRYVIGEFEKEIGRARRHDRTMAVMMLDVDSFKVYNDTWGHQAGDEVLRGMGTVLRDATRDNDVPGRYGGEEFIVLLPDCDIQGATSSAERVRARLDREIFDGRKVTASIGVAEFPTHGDTPGALIAAADTALYEAKAQGRDRVVAAGAAEAPKRVPGRKAAAKKPAAGTAAARRPAAKKAAARKATAKKASAKKATPKKASTKKATPKKAAAKKATGKKASAKKATGKKATAKQTTATKTAAKKTGGQDAK